MRTLPRTNPIQAVPCGAAIIHPAEYQTLRMRARAVELFRACSGLAVRGGLMCLTGGCEVQGTYPRRTNIWVSRKLRIRGGRALDGSQGARHAEFTRKNEAREWGSVFNCRPPSRVIGAAMCRWFLRKLRFNEGIELLCVPCAFQSPWLP